MWKYLIAWFPMIFIAIANGLFREKFLRNLFNELQAHQLSSLTLIVLFGIYVWVLFKIWKPETVNQALMIGLLWLFLTVVFEFLFGHYIAGHSWSTLLHDYNILEGRVWIFILIWVTIAPYLIFKILQ
ncbi:MAG: hypothetical protein AB3N14_00735 [Flavobacteriaceae bacterium]